MLSTARFDEPGIGMRVVRRGGAYSVEVTSDWPRPNAVLHWACNDWTLPPQVGAAPRRAGARARLRRAARTATCPQPWHRSMALLAAWYAPQTAHAPPLPPAPGAVAARHAPGGRQGRADAAGRRRQPPDADLPGGAALRLVHLLPAALPPCRPAAGAALLPAAAPAGCAEAAGPAALAQARRCFPAPAAAPLAARAPLLASLTSCTRPWRPLPATPQATCPQRIVFVIKDGEEWTGSGGGDFVAHLKPPGAEGAWTRAQLPPAATNTQLIGLPSCSPSCRPVPLTNVAPHASLQR